MRQKPELGELCLHGIPTEEFSQDDINFRRVSYKVIWDKITSCKQSDSFVFELENKSSRRRDSKRHQFKIAITYTAIEDLNKIIRISPITLTPGILKH